MTRRDTNTPDTPRATAADGLRDLDAEEAALGAVLVDAAALAPLRAALAPVGGPAAFAHPPHGLLYGALCAVADAGGDVTDPHAAATALRETGSLEAAGGLELVGYLLDVVPHGRNVGAYAARVARCAERRRVVAAAQTAIDAASAPGSDPSAVAGAAVADLVRVATADARGARGFVRVRDDLHAVMAELGQPAPADGIVGVPTGWHAFDDATGGVLEGEMAAFCAVPGGCKSVSLINVATYNALGGEGMRHGARRPAIAGGFVSAEMTRAALIKRALCNLAEIDTETMRKRRFRDADWPRLTRGAQLLADAPLYIDETPAPSLDDLFARLRGIKAEHPEIRYFCVDYLQLISDDSEDAKAEEIRHVAKHLKAIAKELRVAMFTAAQVNDKDTERRKEGSKKPGLADIQGSSGIRQACDIIVLQHRPALYGENVGGDVVQMDGAKNREMKPFWFSLDAELEYQRLVPARLTHSHPRAA